MASVYELMALAVRSLTYLLLSSSHIDKAAAKAMPSVTPTAAPTVDGLAELGLELEATQLEVEVTTETKVSTVAFAVAVALTTMVLTTVVLTPRAAFSASVSWMYPLSTGKVEEQLYEHAQVVSEQGLMA